MGSVKDLTVIVPPEKDKKGKGRFTFSDRYSVFDWGGMPQEIEGKGAALCITGAFFFEKLKSVNILNHYRGVEEEGEIKELIELKEPSNVMEVDLVRVLTPPFKDGNYDYSIYGCEKKNLLVPLEVIYRNSLPEGSSLLSRIKRGELEPADIGLEQIPPPGTVLDTPILDVSTKLESKDRYMNWEEAARISGLSTNKLSRIKNIVLDANRIISSEVDKMNLVNVDGKLEFALDGKGEVVVVDVAGTPDECRFIYRASRGISVSKEILRKYYRNTPWHREVEEASATGNRDWKKMVNTDPPPAPRELIETVSWVYKSFCNSLTGRDWFDVPGFEEVINRLDSLQKNFK